MGSLSGLVGGGGGIMGTGVSGPTAAQTIAPVNAQQIGTAYTGTQNALAQQQAFLNALQAQNGIQNQSNIYNQLQNVANGTGPNPAQAQLAQATGANISNQAALMAGQRGSSANTGLMARQAAQQGAQTQQQAAGQAAALQSQQSLNALSGLGQMATNQVNQQANATTGVTGAQQNEQANLMNSAAGYNNANIAMQSNLNNNNTALAGIQLQGQQNLMGGLMNSGSQFLSSMMASGGQVRRNYDEGGEATNAQDAPPEQQGQTQDDKNGPQSFVGQFAQNSNPTMNEGSTQENSAVTPTGVQASAGPNIGSTSVPTISNAFQSTSGGGGGGGGGIASLATMFADGGQPTQVQVGSGPNIGSTSVPTISNAFKFSKSKDKPSGGGTEVAGGPSDSNSNNTGGGDGSDTGQTAVGAYGGKVPALVSPGEIRLHRKDLPKIAKGKQSPLDGEKIKGIPKVKGAVNSYANDTVPKTLNEGDIILPRSVTQSKHPHWAAHKFVSAIMAKNGLPKKGK